jgi:uncharacterized membrane protein YhaH (DUF805 family)
VLWNSIASVVVSIFAFLLFAVFATGLGWTGHRYAPAQLALAQLGLFGMLGAIAGFDYWLIVGANRLHARRTAMIYLAVAVVLFFAVYFLTL